MSVVTEIIRLEDDQTLSFGNYAVDEKQKAENFEARGDLYKVKTHREVTRLEKNGSLLLETVPGAAVFNFRAAEDEVTFSISGFEGTSVTTGLESDTGYRVFIDGKSIGEMRSHVGGKISFGIELGETPQSVRIEKA